MAKKNDREYYAKYRQTEKYKPYRVINAVAIRQQKKKNREANAKKIYEYNKIYFIDYEKTNKDKLKEYRRNRYIDKKEEMKIRNKLYYIQNSDKIKEKTSVYSKVNRNRLLELQKERDKNRRRIDPMFKLVGNLRSRLYNCFKRMGYWKNSSTEIILGAPFDIVSSHIGNKFTEGMNWDNYGEWHVDHKIPLASAKCEVELILLCHYTNLQPLWKIDNLKKWARINYKGGNSVTA